MKITRKRVWSAGLIGPILFTLAASPAFSAPDAALSACRQITDLTSRVACYDKAIDAEGARDRSSMADTKAVPASPQQRFGLNRPPRALRSPSRRAAPKPKPVESITVELAKAQRDPQGDWVMTTTDGAIWRQVNDDRPYKPPHVGSTMGIRRALMGGFFCTVDGQAAVRCVRDD